MVGQGTIVATGSISYPVGLEAIGAQIGAEKVMTMTSTYDHRIIQGAESGRFLKVIEEYLQGEHGFYEAVFSALGASLPALPAASGTERRCARRTAGCCGFGPAHAQQRTAAAAPPPARSCCRRSRPRPRCSRPTGCTAIWRRSSIRSAARPGRPGAGSGQRRADARADGADPGADPADVRAGRRRWRRRSRYLRETYCGPIAYEIEHIASHRQRLWLREAIESGTYRKPLSAEEQKQLLERLTAVDSFERFMGRAYLGAKRFSVEGIDMTVPMIDEIVGSPASTARARSSSAWRTAAA